VPVSKPTTRAGARGALVHEKLPELPRRQERDVHIEGFNLIQDPLHVPDPQIEYLYLLRQGNLRERIDVHVEVHADRSLLGDGGNGEHTERYEYCENRCLGSIFYFDRFFSGYCT